MTARWEQTGKAASRIEVPVRPGLTGYKLSRDVTKLKSIRGIDKVVLRTLADHYPDIWPALDTIAHLSGFGVTAVRDAIRRLERANWIELLGDLRGGRHRTHQFVLNVNRILDEVENPPPDEPFPSRYEKSRKQNPPPGVGKPSASRTERVRVACEKGPCGGPEVISKRTSEENREENSAFAPRDFQDLFPQIGKQQQIALTDEERKNHAMRVRQQAAEVKARTAQT